MSKYEFKATNLIAETFEKRGVRFDVKNVRGDEVVCAGFPIDCGPKVIMQFICSDNDNDVAVRIFGLVTKTPKEKRSRVMEACNILNRKVRYVKFYVDGDGDINVEYDFPVHTPDEGVGEIAFEIFLRMMTILDSEYSIFMKALYTDEELARLQDYGIPEKLVQKLQELREKSEARKAVAGEAGEEELAIEDHDIHEELMQKLQELREKIEARKAAAGEAGEEEPAIEDHDIHEELMQKLRELRKKIEARKAAAGEAGEDEDPNDSDPDAEEDDSLAELPF